MTPEEEQKQNTQEFLAREIAKLEREQERKRSEEYIKRSEAWLNRLIATAIGFVIGMMFACSLSECSRLNNRVSVLESKQHP